MGFYFKKSIKVGLLRFNFSKSGIGLSTGVKGFRIGTGPRGNYIHLGANGFYYKKTIGNTNKIENIQPLIDSKSSNEYKFKEIESGNVRFMTDSSFDEILKELNDKAKIFSVIPVSIFLPILLFFAKPILILTCLILIPLALIIDKKLKTTYVIYDIENTQELELQQFYDCFNAIINTHKKWHISSTAGVDSNYQKKINAGASNLVHRTRIVINYGVPTYVATNVKVPVIPVGKQILYFFPERIIIKDGKKFGTINYQDLQIHYGNTQFIETEGIPSDSEIIGKTWRYVNKKGGPDRRFKDNIEIPILRYSEIYFQSNSGLNELIQLSKPNLGEELLNALKTKKI